MTEPAASWRARTVHQRPQWPPRELGVVVDRLATAPALVAPRECDALTERLAAVAEGRAFLVQGGDCAERLGEIPAVRGKLRLLREMARIIAYAVRVPVVSVGRMAGQYAKPRSRPTETVAGRTLPAYRGDAVNGTGCGPGDRRPDPARLHRIYEASRATRGVMRTYAPEVYASHEGLLLDYEEALTRTDEQGRRYATSGHLLWIGDRTRQLDGAHVAWFATVANPIAVKLGPATTPEQALALIDRLDPDRRPGRLTFVVRFGARGVRDLLPELVAKVTASGAPVSWVCDPMHGNTFAAPTGHKTRRLTDIMAETAAFVEVHRALGTQVGGLHVEMTGENVTECVGGGVGFADLPRRYESACDPRLNRGQALELATALADLLQQGVRDATD